MFYRDAAGGRNFGRGWWQQDWPEAEQHLIRGIKRLTRIDTADEGHYLGILDDALFDYPGISNPTTLQARAFVRIQ